MTCTQKLVAYSQKHFPLLCITSLLLGVLVGDPAARLSPCIPYLMGLLMFSSGLGLRLRDLHSLYERPWLLPIILLMLHGIIPLISLAVSTALGFPPEVVIGLGILAIIPISGTSLVWVIEHKGNVTLCMGILLADTLITPFIIPYLLDFLFGAEVSIDPVRMLRGLFWMLFFPTILAIALNRLSQGALQRVAGLKLSLLGKIAVYVIVFINGGIVAPQFHHVSPQFFIILVTVFLFCAFWFVFTLAVACVLFPEKEDAIALMLGSSIRGTSTGMVIATVYFGPLTMLTVVFNMMFQQPLGAWFGRVAMRWLSKREARKHAAAPLR